jgi:hypothetical protein
MENRIIIKDPELAQRIERIARQEHRSVREVLASMVTEYKPREAGGDLPDADALARHVRLAAYREARDYWRSTGDKKRAAMTDGQLDEQFWLFDADGIPRLIAEKDSVELPESSLHRAGQVLITAGFHSGQSDVSTRSREILDTEFTDYLLEHMNRPADNDKTPAD